MTRLERGGRFFKSTAVLATESPCGATGWVAELLQGRSNLLLGVAATRICVCGGNNGRGKGRGVNDC